MEPPQEKSAEQKRPEEEQYEIALKKAHDFFRTTGPVKSPLIGDIYFNSEGLLHLIYEDADRKEKRNILNQMKRFEMLQNVPHVLQNMTHCQEYVEISKSVQVKMNKQRVFVSKEVRYWGFVAVIKSYKKRIKIRASGQFSGLKL